jgi:hypothetical protein
MSQSSDAPNSGMGPEPGPLGRLMGVFFSPAKTFESIARKPGMDWMLPVAILMLLTVVGGVLVNPKLDTDTAIKDTMKRIEARRPLTDAQREQTQHMVERQFGWAKGPLRFIGPVFVLIPLLLVPAFYLGTAKAMGVAAKYGTILAGYAYCQAPQIVKAIIGLAVAVPRDSIDFNEVEHIVKSNVGSFLDPDTTSKPLMALMNSVDLFEIWGLVLGSIMLARTTKFSKNAATVAVVSLWVLWVLLKFGGAALGAAFGG